MEEQNVELETQIESEEITEETKAEELIDDKNTEEKSKKQKLTRKEKKELRRQKKRAKIQKKMFFDEDIKYRGIFSYRHLRIIAWVGIAATQLLAINNFTAFLLPTPFLDTAGNIITSIVASLAVPLFLLATFSIILNKNKTYRSAITFYLFAYLGLALGIVIGFERYLKGILTVFNDTDLTPSKAAGVLMGSRFEVNVFADMLALSLFHFFLNYNPKKYFQGKKIKIFRWLAVVPLIFAAVSYIIKVNVAMNDLTIPFELYPFLTTKPPFVYLLFILLTFWFKKREKTYLSFGSTKEQYENFLTTKKNSLSFSINTSLILAFISFLDAIALVTIIAIFGENFAYIAEALEIGQCAGLFIAIPVVMLFSYNKKYKTSNLDIIIPIAGIGLVVFTYVEAIYEIALKLLA